MRTLHQSLRLQHHRHTGKLLHHRHTSYRSLVIIFVVAGSFMVGLSAISHAAADDFGVDAMVAAPVPASPPIISSPSTDTSISGSALVTGSCPMVTPQAVISIAVDGSAVGTSACDASNDFSVPVSLSAGSHKVTATALTVTGQSGPTSDPVAVLSDGSSTPSSGITLSSDQPFVYAGARLVTWTGSIGGTKTADYVHIDWGDNSQSNYVVQPGAQSFSHRYTALASHNILFAISDKAGESVSEQFASSAFTTYVAPVVDTGSSSPFTQTVLGLYGLYVSALSITAIIWLEAKHAARQHSHAVA